MPKPSELAPITPLMLGEVLHEAGLPAGVTTWCRDTGRPPDCPWPRIRAFGAVIAFEDVDVERCVAATVFAAFVGSGQTCVQGARLPVHRSLYDRAVAGLVRRARAIRLGDPLEKDTQMGPLASAKQRHNVERYVRSGIE